MVGHDESLVWDKWLVMVGHDESLVWVMTNDLLRVMETPGTAIHSDTLGEPRKCLVYFWCLFQLRKNAGTLKQGHSPQVLSSFF